VTDELSQVGREKLKLKIQIISTEKVSEVVLQNLQSNVSQLAMITLFGGDRIMCCDEGFGLFDDQDQVVGMITIAPKGETCCADVPTIVGLWVHPIFRQKGFGKNLLEYAIKRCLERGFSQIRIDLLTKSAKHTCNALSEDLRKVLVIHDQSDDFRLVGKSLEL
jgi:GNAT superfamily N-acetyltransferase